MEYGPVDLGQQGTKMKIIFVRHGEPDYRELEERSYTGFGIDLAPLSEKGRKQAQDLCQNPLFQSADLLVASAVTRAIETARCLFLENKGELLPNSPVQYETAVEMKSRFLECMAKYREHQTVVVVAHRMLMRQFVPNEKIDFCQVIECEIEI